MTATKSASTRLADRYIRCDDFASRIDGIELSPDVWAVFAQLAQSRTAAEIAQHLKLDVESASAAIRRLVRRKLARKHVLAWRDYAASAAPLPATTTTFEAPSAPAAAPVTTTTNANASSLSAPPFCVTSAQPAPATRSPIISLRIASPAATPRTAPAVSLRIEPARSSPPAKSAATGLRLRPVLDAIGAKAGGGVAGQLLVYRVFLQIPTELMQAAGLHSLSLVDDHFTLRHPELRSALAETARRHADVDIEAFAAA